MPVQKLFSETEFYMMKGYLSFISLPKLNIEMLLIIRIIFNRQKAGEPILVHLYK